jgi:hypothetical protein
MNYTHPQNNRSLSFSLSQMKTPTWRARCEDLPTRYAAGSRSNTAMASAPKRNTLSAAIVGNQTGAEKKISLKTKPPSTVPTVCSCFPDIP